MERMELAANWTELARILLLSTARCYA